MKKVFGFLMCIFVLSGCTPTERIAYNLVTGGKAALVTYRAKHPECNFDAKTGLSLNTKVTACVANNRLTSGKDAIIDAAEIYCSGTDFENGGACNPPTKGTSGYTQAVAKLQASINSYLQIQKDLKGVI